MGLWLFLGALVLIVVFFISIFNRLVSLKNRFANAFAQIDVQLQRRYDLIPNLVETAKAYLQHEKETLTAVIAARNQAASAERALRGDVGNAQKLDSFAQAEGILGSALGRLMAVVESYPELKADQTMLSLMEELSATENRIGFARQAFNDSVMDYNTYRQQFPNFFIAGAFGFQPAALLPLTNQEAKQAVKVSFS